jgi:transcriptional regulator with XRE-family HTH domain
MGRPSSTTRPVNGTVLAARRTDLGLTRVQVSDQAAEAGYSLDDSNLSKLENGKTRYPGLETRLAITAVLGLTDDEMHAPCKRYGHNWSPACLNHGTSSEAASTAKVA